MLLACILYTDKVTHCQKMSFRATHARHEAMCRACEVHVESGPEAFFDMPIIRGRGVPKQAAAEMNGEAAFYQCPCYQTAWRQMGLPTPTRGSLPGGLFLTALLKTDQPASKWVLAGVGCVNLVRHCRCHTSEKLHLKRLN